MMATLSNIEISSTEMTLNAQNGDTYLVGASETLTLVVRDAISLGNAARNTATMTNTARNTGVITNLPRS